MIIISIEINCDECDDVFYGPFNTNEKGTREEAKKNGWINKDGKNNLKDLCPNCQKQKL